MSEDYPITTEDWLQAINEKLDRIATALEMRSSSKEKEKEAVK